MSQCPVSDATLTLLGLGKEFEANCLPASLTGQQHQGGLLKNTEVPAAFCAFLMAFPLCVPRLREDAGAAQQRGLSCSFSVFSGKHATKNKCTVIVGGKSVLHVQHTN